MIHFKPLAWALLAVALTDLPAQAAWNNVFQPTLFGRLRQPSVSNYYVAPACNTCTPSYSSPVVAYAAPACPTACAPTCQPCQQQCTTNYVQRSYYQPVTTYESRSYYEPVTTYQTSYYYEPVTCNRTSYYYDSCNCNYQAVNTPVTSYQLKQQTCPVQSWVQRCAQVPVTSYQKSYYLEPQTTCCNTTVGAPVAMSAAPAQVPCQQAQAPAQQQYTPPAQNSGTPPVIDQQRTPPSGPNVGASRGYQTNYSPTASNSNWQPAAQAPVVILDRIAQEPRDSVQGQVTLTDRQPRANAQVLFVNATTGARHSATTNNSGQFNVALASGNYHVYLASQSGSAAYHSQVQVTPHQTTNLNLVNQ